MHPRCSGHAVRGKPEMAGACDMLAGARCAYRMHDTVPVRLSHKRRGL
jgi:hypothetical protein